MKKNDVINLKITDFSTTGSGMGRYGNTVVFVPNAAVGDEISAQIIKVNKSYCIGKLIDIIEPSTARIVPDCGCFLKCGGCTYRHINYDSELMLKQKRVEDCINRIGKISLKSCPIVSNMRTDRYRNKAQFPVNGDGDVGFFAPHSHRIIPTNDCLLQPEIFSRASLALKTWMTENNVSAYDDQSKIGLVRHLYVRSNSDLSEIMVTLVINGNSVPNPDRLKDLMCDNIGNALKSLQLNVNTKQNNVILGDSNILIYGNEYINDTICGVKVRLSPNSFYQVNHGMAELLYNKVKEYAEPKGKTVIDLYCGTGTIGLTMAEDCKNLIGVEIVPQAVADAKINAKENNIKNAEFICSDSLKASKTLKEKGIIPDIVIVDPPRKGCDENLIKIISEDFSPERVVYVSCDPSTLARDLNIFTDFGYKLIEYTPFDLFPRTPHVETVVLLSRR